MGVVVVLVATGEAVHAEDYRLPPRDVVAIVDAAPAPVVRLSPDRQWMILLEPTALPSIEDISRPMLRLAGTRIDPGSNARFRTSFYRGLSVRGIIERETRRLPMPPGGRLASVSWSHDSRHVAYTVVTDDGTELWAASVDSEVQPRRLLAGLNTVTGGVRWMPDGTTILCRLVPEGRGPEPKAPRAPRGPNTQESSGERSPLRTYQDLLSNAHDAALFDHYATTQLVLVSVTDGAVTAIGTPAVYGQIAPAPDGRHLLVTRVRKPYSYQMPWWSFAHDYEVWNAAGQRLHTVITGSPRKRPLTSRRESCCGSSTARGD